jgi:2-keto-4-pentenoate hydratase
VLSATAYALPAIEIIDSRITGWQITLPDTIADNASSGGLVLGATATPVAGLDLALLGCVLRRNGRIELTGAGAAVMARPCTPPPGWPTRSPPAAPGSPPGTSS